MMRTEYVNAPSVEAAGELCPWAAEIIEVDNGGDGERRWVCFESVDDARPRHDPVGRVTN